jgi:hypothetical protein
VEENETSKPLNWCTCIVSIPLCREVTSTQRMDALERQDFEFQCVNGPTSRTMEQSRIPGVEDSLVNNRRAPVSWKCELCGYHMLAMDHRGVPLPLGRGPRDELLPVYCSRCDKEHVSWVQSSPFDTLGDHANVRAAFSDKVNSGVPLPSDAVRKMIKLTAPNIAALQPHVYGGPNKTELLDRTASHEAQTYACGRCGRSLLRLDANGKVVQMDRDVYGNLAPLECPGCHATHGDWVLTPMGFPVRPVKSVPSIGFATREDIAEEQRLLERPVRKVKLF